MRQGQHSREGYHVLSQFHLKSCMNRERVTGGESRARTEQRGAVTNRLSSPAPRSANHSNYTADTEQRLQVITTLAVIGLS